MQITHIYGKYKFRPLFYISVFHNWPIFKESIWCQTRRSKRSKRGQLTQIGKFIYIWIFFGANTHLILLGLQNMDLYLHLTFYPRPHSGPKMIHTRRSKRSKRGQLTQNWIFFLHMLFFGANNSYI